MMKFSHDVIHIAQFFNQQVQTTEFFAHKVIFKWLLTEILMINYLKYTKIKLTFPLLTIVGL